jgi:hypothetical protein
VCLCLWFLLLKIKESVVSAHFDLLLLLLRGVPSLHSNYYHCQNNNQYTGNRPVLILFFHVILICKSRLNFSFVIVIQQLNKTQYCLFLPPPPFLYYFSLSLLLLLLFFLLKFTHTHKHNIRIYLSISMEVYTLKHPLHMASRPCHQKQCESSHHG